MAKANIQVEATAKGFEEVNGKLDSIADTSRFTAFAQAVQLASRILTEAFNQVKEGITNAIRVGAQYDAISNQMGVLAGDARVLTRAFEMNGATAQDAVNAYRRLTISLNGTGKAFERLGLDKQALKSKNAIEQIKLVSDKLREVNSDSERLALSQEIFGRSGLAMQKMINSPTAMNTAQMSIGGEREVLNKVASTIESVGTKLTQLNIHNEQLYLGIMEKVAPVLNTILDELFKIDSTGIGNSIGELVAGSLSYYNKMLAIVDTISQSVKTSSSSLAYVGAAWKESFSDVMRSLPIDNKDWKDYWKREHRIDLANKDRLSDATDKNFALAVEKFDKISKTGLVKPKIETPYIPRLGEEETSSTRISATAKEEMKIGGSKYLAVGGYATALEAGNFVSDIPKQQLSVAQEQLRVQNEIVSGIKAMAYKSATQAVYA